MLFPRHLSASENLAHFIRAKVFARVVFNRQHSFKIKAQIALRNRWAKQLLEHLLGNHAPRVGNPIEYPFMSLWNRADSPARHTSQVPPNRNKAAIRAMLSFPTLVSNGLMGNTPSSRPSEVSGNYPLS